MNKLLIVVDMQNDFINGSLGTKEAQAIVPNVSEKIKEYTTRGDSIIFTRDTHFSDYLDTQEGKKLPVAHCIKDTHGWQIADELKIDNALFVDKNTFGWEHWRSTFKEYFGMVQFDSIELVGLCTDICVVSNALILKALFPETEISVDRKCCAGVTPHSHLAALETMKSCQINIL